MKIKKIERKEGNIFIVTFKPNWLRRLFGAKEKQIEYKDTDRHYWITNTPQYIDKTGKDLGPFNSISKAINNWRNAW